MKHLTITLLTLLVLGGCSEVNLEDLTETEHISSPDSLVFVCKNFDEPLTFVIDQDTVTFGSVDVKNTFKILKRTSDLIQWEDDSFVKLPWNVKHSLDLINSQISIEVLDRKIDCIKTNQQALQNYEKDMVKVIEEDGWSPALPSLGMYLQIAENKNHPKVIHQMHLRCLAALDTLATNLYGISCKNFNINSSDEELKNCITGTEMTQFKSFRKSLQYHTNVQESLNLMGNYLSDDQEKMQVSIFKKAYYASLEDFLKQAEDESCWGEGTGVLCMDEELNMCEVLRKEKNMQRWYDNLEINK